MRSIDGTLEVSVDFMTDFSVCLHAFLLTWLIPLCFVALVFLT